MRNETELLRAIADETKIAWNKGWLRLSLEAMTLKNLLTDRIDMQERKKETRETQLLNQQEINMKNKKFIEKIRTQFELNLSTKTGWGKNAALNQLDQAISEVALKILKEQEESRGVVK